MDLERMAFNIKYYRRKNNWTQVELSEEMMISRSVIAKWESSHVKPDIESLVIMSDLFKVSIDELIGNFTLRDDVMKDADRIYKSRQLPLDDETINLAHYLKVYPDIKDHLAKIKELPFKKQRSLLNMLDTLIQELKLYHS